MNSMKTKKQKGFTLIELLITVVITLIMVLGVGTVLVGGHTLWNKGLNNVNLQRDASYAMLLLRRPIKAATNAKVESNGTALRIYRKEGGWIRFSLVAGTDTPQGGPPGQGPIIGGSNGIQSKVQGQSPQTIIGNNVEDLEFNVEDNRVKIDLKLKKDNLRMHLVSTVLMRNYGG